MTENKHGRTGQVESDGNNFTEPNMTANFDHLTLLNMAANTDHLTLLNMAANTDHRLHHHHHFAQLYMGGSTVSVRLTFCIVIVRRTETF